MYPKLSDMINDLFGTNINLPINSYGFFVVLAFILPALVFYFELKRKEKQGLLKPQTKNVLTGRPASVTELIILGVIGFIVGYKAIGMLFSYSHFTDNPLDFLFSSQGNLPGAIVSGAALSFNMYWKKKKSQLDPPVWKDEIIHPYQLTGTILLIAMVSGVAGAKIFHLLENLDKFLSDPMGSLFSMSGLTFYGGLIVATIAVYLYVVKHKFSRSHIADAIAPALMLAYAIGRIGCQVSGDGDWGIENLNPKPEWLGLLPDWAWAYDYPHNIIGRGILIPGCTGPHCYKLVTPVFPTPVYETTVCLLFFSGLMFFRNKIRIPGLLFSIYFILNGLERFFIEKIRINETYSIAGYKIAQAEIISVFFILLGVSGLLFFYRKYRNTD